jgi:ABC-type multidrug transport system ATPase subunit
MRGSTSARTEGDERRRHNAAAVPCSRRYRGWTMIRVRGLTRHFRGASGERVVAVAGLDLDVAPGTVYGMLGPNGAGKTTTLKILATLTEPDAGEVIVAGVDRRRDPLGVRARLGWVPAEAGLPERLTPREVVRLFAEVQGVARADAAATRWLGRLGADGYADRPCQGLSTGMKRRVVLARALVHEPQVVLLDEPTDGLDVPGRRDVLDVVVTLAREGRTVVLSSHILGEVRRVADRVGLVAAGVMRAEGTVAELLDRTETDDLDQAFLRLVGATS